MIAVGNFSQYDERDFSERSAAIEGLGLSGVAVHRVRYVQRDELRNDGDDERESRFDHASTWPRKCDRRDESAGGDRDQIDDGSQVELATFQNAENSDHAAAFCR